WSGRRVTPILGCSLRKLGVPISQSLSLSTRRLNIRDDRTLSPSVIRSPVSLQSSGTVPSPSLDLALVRPFVSL
ncbi:hypothetical protein BDZ94DRAFT_1272968, partial [Collybia nuda]